MAHQVASYDRFRELAHDLDATMIAGAVAPPMNGRMWVADRALDELLLPDGQACMVTMLIAPGGPPQHYIALGHGTLDEAGRQRLGDLAAATRAALVEGRLALLTPADWLALHPSPEQLPGAAGAANVLDGMPIDSGDSEIGSVENSALLERAQAQGWPSNLSNGPNLFVDDRPLYHIMAQENVGRNIVLLVARHADPH
jgi:hypothetical protein